MIYPLEHSRVDLLCKSLKMFSPALLLLLLSAACCCSVQASHSIDDYGAVPNDLSEKAATANSAAMVAALKAANTTANDRTVLVPPGKSYYYFVVRSDYLQDVTLQVEGVLLASNNISSSQWPSDGTYATLWFQYCRGLTLTGSGTIDGQGYDWWWHVIVTDVDHRPHLVIMEQCSDILITNLRFIDSPQFHLKLDHIMNVVIRNITIFVDIGKQKNLLQKSGNWIPFKSSNKNELDLVSLLSRDPYYKEMLAKLPPELEKILEALGVPTFPLNTDGIDPRGKNVLIENVNITNFDDAVAVKPCNQGDPFTNCSQNMTIRNSFVAYGVGMTIGSVPPNGGVNCVKDILFENITFEHPIKALYIKSNPGDSGTGIVDSITFRNIHGKYPLWYPIWIGPQQQKQPGTTGTGCSWLYPVQDECPTQPRVAITNIVLDNVSFVDGVTLPGVLLGNVTAPYTGFKFTNVTSQGVLAGEFLVQQNYVCKNVQGTGDKLTTPFPPCFTQG